VSLYNETNGQAILPTPTIGAIGLLADHEKAVGIGFVHEGDAIVVIGDTHGHLGQSLYLRELHGREDGPPPPVDLQIERRNGDLVRDMILTGLVNACHDIADGGLLVAVAEMAMGGGIGAKIDVPSGPVPAHAWLFGEDQGRYLVATGDPDAVMAKALAAGVSASRVGSTGGDGLELSSGESAMLSAIRTKNEGWLPGFMGAA